MKRAHLTRMVAGVGTAVGAVMILGSMFAGCAPGTICDKEGYDDLCPPTGGTGGMTPAPSGTGGTGGSAPTPMGNGGTTGARVVDDGTRVDDCAKAPTVGEVESKIFAVKCAEAGCHVPMGVFKPDLKSGQSFRRLLDKVVEYTATKCKDDVYVKTGDPMKSYFLSTVKDAQPRCSDGRMGGMRMPFAKPPLPDDEIKCIEGYVKALAGPGQ